MLMRIIVYLFLSEEYTVRPVLISDVIVLGLVLSIATFNERHDLFGYPPKISDNSTTVSVLLIVLFSIMFILAVTNEVIQLFRQAVLWGVSIILDFVTLATCIVYIIYRNSFIKEKKPTPKEGQ